MLNGRLSGLTSEPDRPNKQYRGIAMVYVSLTESGFTLIQSGLPLCGTKGTIQEIFDVVKYFRLEKRLENKIWNGITGHFEECPEISSFKG